MKIYRCKKFKADGGMVDGCGWQGTAGLRFPDNCPECGSPYVREVTLGSSTFPAPVDAVLQLVREHSDLSFRAEVIKPREHAGYAVAELPLRLQLSPWDGCVVTYVVRNVDKAQDINLHEALPKGWALISSERMGNSTFFRLEFEVQGEVSDRDGVIVRSIIERLGMR